MQRQKGNFRRIVNSSRLPYPTLFGGVTAIKREHFELVNGHSNKFFGWGGEDDDMFRRLPVFLAFMWKIVDLNNNFMSPYA